MNPVILIQGTAPWFRWRCQGIGGSDAPVVLGLAPWEDATPHALWLRKTGKAPDVEDTFAMRRGRRLEPIARQLYEQLTGHLVSPLCGEHEERAWMLASLDGITLLGDLIVEIKAPDWETHELALAGQVPDYYFPQVQHQLAVSGAELAHYVSLTENKRFGASKDSPQIAPPVEVLPQPDYIARLVEAEREFWKCVLDRRPPTSGGGLGAKAASFIAELDTPS